MLPALRTARRKERLAATVYRLIDNPCLRGDLMGPSELPNLAEGPANLAISCRESDTAMQSPESKRPVGGP